MKLCCVNCFQTRLIIDEYCISVLFLSRPAVDRFKKPYLHNIITAGGNPRTLVIHQAPFSTAGFASTVWDSAIVLAKYMERWPEKVVGKRCIELVSGCGLAGGQ
jgi:predicted nicotinamide N-methyase